MDSKNKVINFIKNNKLEDAISTLINITSSKNKNDEYENILIDIQQRYYSLKKKEFGNLISNEESLREQSKISYSILEINNALYSNKPLSKIKNKERSEDSSLLRIDITMPLLAILIITSFMFFYIRSKKYDLEESKTPEKLKIDSDFGNNNKVEQTYDKALQKGEGIEINNTFRDSNIVNQHF